MASMLSPIVLAPSSPLVSQSPARLAPRPRPIGRLQNGPCPSGGRGSEVRGGPMVRMPAASSIPMVLVGVLICVALLVAPEQPQDQEAICQRHSGEVACRVW